MRGSHPFLIKGPDAEGEELLPLQERAKVYDESWLQELLYRHPTILPVDEIDEAYGPPISLGREIANIDNLFISPKGLLTVVETKLWRNPEAHRTVVAQILDYAHTLTTWDYQELDSSVQSLMAKRTGKPRSIHSIVTEKRRTLDLTEIEFQERVQEGLTTGRFLLLIVGDKIFPGATQLAEIIQSAPHLQFSLGFVELQCFRVSREEEWPLIVVPKFVIKTKEITRAVVKVLYEEKRPEIEVVTPEEERAPAGRTTLPEFLASLPAELREVYKSHIEAWVKAGYIVYWGKVGFSVRISWKGKTRTIIDAYPNMTSIFQQKWVNEFDLQTEPYEKYKTQVMTSPVIGNAFAAGRRYVFYENLPQDDVVLLLRATDEFMREVWRMR